MNHQDILTRLREAHTLNSYYDYPKVAASLSSIIDDLEKDLSNGITTARARSLTQDHTLWHRPPHGTPFLLDWGTKEAMEAKLAEMVIEPPVKTETEPLPA